MIEEKFDSRTLANMNVARGEEHSFRKRIAKKIVKCARSGKTTLTDLTAAGQRALNDLATAAK
jgi:hypothetical protein